jgi:hypothetical protein
MKQREITEKTELLKQNGELTAPGYCIRNNYIFNKECIAYKNA